MKVKMALVEGSDPTGWRCIECGCTDDDCSGCVEKTGAPCWWVDDNLCSACDVPELLGPEAFGELGPIGDTPIGELAEPIMPKFLEGCVRSGMVEAVCSECGRPWLTRPKLSSETVKLARQAILFMQRPELPKLCPVCDPEHPGHEPGGPPDRQRWVDFWRVGLLGVLQQRARPVLELMPASVWVEHIPLQRVGCVAPLGGQLIRWYIQGLGAVDQVPSWPPATFAKGCRLVASMPVGLMVAALVIPSVEPDPERTTRYSIAFLPVAG